MVASEDYDQLAQRCAQLAIALTILALDYLAQSHRLSQPSAAEQQHHQIQVDPSAGFGD